MLLFLFFFSLIVILYTFLGYPFLLVIWSRFLPEKSDTKGFCLSSNYPTLDVILVVHNGEAFIEDKLSNLAEMEYPGERPRIIVVLDGCTDNTKALIAASDANNIIVIEQEEKRGKPHGLNLAVEHSSADLLLMTDVRQPILPTALTMMTDRFSDPVVAAVSGELVFRQEGISDFGKGMDAYWRYEKLIREKESIVGSVAGVTGAIYVLRRGFYKPIPPETLLDDVLIPMQAVQAGGKVKFAPGAYAFDIPSNDIQREKQRKTRTLAGNFQLVQLNPGLINPFKNPIWFQFISHKMLRLLSPFLMVLIFVSNLLLVQEGWFFLLTMLGQCAFYCLAIVAFKFESARRVRLLSIIHSFLNLMLYTYYGFLAYSRGNYRGLWK